MLKINDIILYGAVGACRVKEFCTKLAGGEEREYAVLETEVAPKTTIYLPMENQTLLNRIRGILPIEQLISIIRNTPAAEAFQNEDEGTKRKYYREVLTECDPAGLIGLIKTLHIRQKEQRAIGKKLHSTDERTLREAQRLLHNELSFVAGIPPEAIPAFLSRELEEDYPSL